MLYTSVLPAKYGKILQIYFISYDYILMIKTCLTIKAVITRYFNIEFIFFKPCRISKYFKIFQKTTSSNVNAPIVELYDAIYHYVYNNLQDTFEPYYNYI